MNRLAAAIPLSGAAQWGPALSSLAPLRRALLPTLSGIAPTDHIALTYDDGPDPTSTPRFLDLLDRHRRTATFFVLGAHVRENRGLVAEMSSRGHEIGVHGWSHRCLAGSPPGALAAELRRTCDVVEDITGSRPQWYRPPYGVMTAEGVYAARRAGLRTVLWSAWGRDWSRGSTPESIVRTVQRSLRPGGTVLLHDSDRTSAPGSWVRTLAASRQLLRVWSDRQQRVGSLGDHWT